MSAGGVAGAQEVDGTSGVGGVTITIVQGSGTDLVHAQGPGVDDGCAYGLEVGPPGFVPDLSTVGPAPPEAHLAVLTCNGAAVGLTWVGPHNTVDLADAARSAARRWVETVPVPAPRVRANPPQAGLVGVESWFWLEDGPPAVISDRVEAFGVGVDVRMVAGPVTWSFGDGVEATGGPGTPWPARSEVRHVYENGGVWSVRAGLRLEPAYRVAGTGWLALPSIPVAAATAHRVGAAQALVVG